MRAAIVPVLALLTFAVTGCDMSQKPRTIAVEVRPAVSAPAAPGDVLGAGSTPAANAAAGREASGERSIRLYGPGVSRKRQTRV